MESKSDKHTRVSTLNVRPSVAGIIADSDGNLDEKKAVAALSQTHEQNKHMWIACFVLIGVVFILIAANIGTSVAVARLTRQLNVDPITGMTTIAGSDDVVMKTSTAIYQEEDVSFHTVSVDYLSAVETVEFADGAISFDVKGFARMSNATILLVEGGSLIFDINGLKNITGDKLTLMFSSIGKDIDGRKLWNPSNYFSNIQASMNNAINSWNAGVARAIATTYVVPAPAPAPLTLMERQREKQWTPDQRCCVNPYVVEPWCGPSNRPPVLSEVSKDDNRDGLFCNENSYWCRSGTTVSQICTWTDDCVPTNCMMYSNYNW